MVLGSSFFIPCLDTRTLAKEILMAARQRKIRLVYKEKVENAKIGLRFWRIK
jgi:hypothetical protein